MNEQIETLAKAAGYDMINKAAMRALGFDVEKFAELIVKECASKVDWIYAEKGITIDGVNFTVTQGDLIKQHFGVEQ